MAEPKRILVVDDDPAIHQLVSSVLDAPEWRIETAHNPQEILSRIQSQRYDLTLTGLRTSGAEDVELLRRVRHIQPSTKLIVMTTESAPSAVIESIRANAFSYFSKPFTSEAVGEMAELALKTPAWDDGIEVLSGPAEWIALRVRCKKTTADRLVQFAKEMEVGLPEEERKNIGTAFREMLLNAIEHGGKLDLEQRVEITCIRTRRLILYLIRDPGEGFSIEQLPHAAISNPPELPAEHAAYREEHGMRPGGFGILLSRGWSMSLFTTKKTTKLYW